MLIGLNLEIEKIKQKFPEERYIDIVLKICEEKNIDVEDLVPYLSKNIIENIKVEFIKANMVKDKKILSSFEDLLK